jgi:hypothetical protein
MMTAENVHAHSSPRQEVSKHSTVDSTRKSTLIIGDAQIKGFEADRIRNLDLKFEHHHNLRDSIEKLTRSERLPSNITVHAISGTLMEHCVGMTMMEIRMLSKIVHQRGSRLGIDAIASR